MIRSQRSLNASPREDSGIAPTAAVIPMTSVNVHAAHQQVIVLIVYESTVDMGTQIVQGRSPNLTHTD